MGWLAIGLVAGAFLFGMWVGVLVIGLGQMVEPRARGDLLAPLDPTTGHRDLSPTVSDLETRLKHRRGN